MNTPFISSIHLSLPLVLLLAKATIILLAALGITLTMQRASAGARHLVWLVTLATLLLVPAMTAWSPVKVAVLTEDRVASSEYSGASFETQAPVTSELRAPTPAPVASVPSGRAETNTSAYSLLATRYSLSMLLLAAWAAITAAILASLAWSGLAVRRIVRNASPLEHDSWRTPLYEVADRMGLADAPRLLRSDDAKMPFACGIITPTIVLPADCDAWTLERRRAVLLHELAHVRRHDLLGHTLGRIACALYWFHPLVWTAAKQLRNESERACDDLALSCGTRATDYAEHLLEIVTSVRKDATPSVALAMARRKEFEGRMLAILDPELRHSSPTRRQSVAMIGALALVALTVGAISPVARTASAAQAAATRATPGAPTAAAPRDTHASFDANSRLLGPMRTAQRSETTYVNDTRTNTQVSTNEAVEQVAQQVMSDVRREERAKGNAAFGDAIAVLAGATTRVTVDAMIKGLADAGVSASAGAAAGAAAGAVASVPSPSMHTLTTPVKGQSKDERARLLAKVLTTDTSASLRRVAAWGLNEYAHDPVAIEALANAVRRDVNARVREMAAWALAEGDSHNSIATDALSAALQGDADESVRLTAAWALGETGDRSAIPALVTALRQPSASLRARALWAIGNIEPKEAPPAIYPLLRDPDSNVRRLAAWALFQIEDPAGVGPLQEALKTEQSSEVQLAEIKAIGVLGERSVEALKSLVESSDPRVRSSAVRALAGGHASDPWPWPWPQPRPFP